MGLNGNPAVWGYADVIYALANEVESLRGSNVEVVIPSPVLTCDRPGCNVPTDGHSALSVTDVGAWAFCGVRCLLLFIDAAYPGTDGR
jgi:hypothetical protein